LSIFKRNVGVLLAYMLILFAFILYMVSFNMPFGKSFKTLKDKLFKEKKWLYIFIVFIPALGVLTNSIMIPPDVKGNSALYLGRTGFFESIFSMLFLTTESTATTVNNTWTSLLNDPVATKLTMLQITGVWIILSALVRYTIRDKYDRRIFMGAAITLFIGLIAYLFALLYAYVNIFPVDSGSAATEFSRFMGIYVFMGFMILYAPLFQKEYELNADGFSYYSRRILILLIVLLSIFQLNNGFINKVTQNKLADDPNYKLQLQVRGKATQILNITSSQDHIYMVAQGKTGYDFVVAFYMLEGRIRYGTYPNYYLFNIKPPGKADNPRMQIEMSEEDFVKRLLDGGYKDLWVYSTDAYFNSFSNLFDRNTVAPDALYEIRREGPYGVKFYFKANVT
jgi:hypothetical protein